MNIRKAVKEDCLAMLELIRELAVYEKAPDEVIVDPQHFEESGFGQHPVWWALVAETDAKQVVGFALYYIRYSTWKGQVLYLEDLLVTESMRGQGIGHQLVDQLVIEAKAKGFRRIVWQVLEWNEPAINFYRKYNAKFDPEWVNVILDI